MNQRDDESIDHELSGVAMAATFEHERTMSVRETEAALLAVRSRIAAGDLGGAPPSIDFDDGDGRRRRSAWVLFGAAAAVMAMVAAGLVAVVGGVDDDVLVPASAPDSGRAPVTSVVPESTAPVTTIVDDTATPVITDAASEGVEAGDVATTVPKATDAPAVVDPTIPPTTEAPGPATDETVGTALPGVERNCVDEFDCTSLAVAADGRIVSFDPTDRAVRVHDASGREVLAMLTVPVPVDATSAILEHVGPDDVAYVSFTPPDAGDPVRELVAVPLAGPNASEVVMRWTGLDGSGDSTLVARRAGLTVVGCCGRRVTRPEPDATVLRWVDRDGQVIESTEPSFDLDLGDAGSSLTRIDTKDDGSTEFTTFTLPALFQSPRDFPDVVATDDGGALASDFVSSVEVRVFVDFDTDWPESGTDNGDVYLAPSTDVPTSYTLEPTGTVIVSTDDGFVRRSLDEIATAGWPGTVETDALEGTVTADGLNRYIDDNAPFWAADPTLFGYQITSAIGPNEQVTVEFDDGSEPVITITTSGFLDDSVAADRIVVTTTRADDGLLRFESATYGVRCARGPDTETFQNELCV